MESNKKAVGLGFYSREVDYNGVVVNKSEPGISFQDEREHIIENVKRILTTRPGERVGNLNFGSNLSKLIFQSERSIEDIFREIIRSVEKWEPRVVVVDCSLLRYEDDTLEVNLELRLKTSGEMIETSLKVGE